MDENLNEVEPDDGGECSSDDPVKVNSDIDVLGDVSEKRDTDESVDDSSDISDDPDDEVSEFFDFLNLLATGDEFAAASAARRSAAVGLDTTVATNPAARLPLATGSPLPLPVPVCLFVLVLFI